MKKQIELWLFTDPVCQFCYYTRPELDNFLLKFGEYVDCKLIFGGMLESFEKYKEEGGFAQKPEDLGQMTLDTAKEYERPVNIQSWLKNPINTSFTPIIFYKAVNNKSDSGEKYLRRLEEEFFLKGNKIDDKKLLYSLIDELEPDNKEIIRSIKDGTAQMSFNQGVQVAISFEVDVFPTIIITDKEKMIGFKGYNSSKDFEEVLKRFIPDAKSKPIEITIDDYIAQYENFTKEEIAIVLEIPKEQIDQRFDNLVSNGDIVQTKIDYSSYYSKS